MFCDLLFAGLCFDCVVFVYVCFVCGFELDGCSVGLFGFGVRVVVLVWFILDLRFPPGVDVFVVLF